VVSLPRVGGTVILAFDVSASMLADDMTPTRMEAAKVAARAFVERQPTTVQVGIVAFSEGGLAVQAPTNDRTALIGAINRLTPARGTSIANGILAALTAIEKAEQEEVTNYYSNRTPMPTPSPTPVPRGFLAPAAIVLLTDGENNVEPDPMVAAELAVERGVRIHTVGIGSPAGARLRIEGFSVHTKLDEAMLQQISHHTAGSYFNARSAEELLDIYQNLGSRFTVKPEETEVTALLAMAGLVVLLVGGALSLLWLGRLP
jgi:Ca-activated chloride channel family protein